MKTSNTLVILCGMALIVFALFMTGCSTIERVKGDTIDELRKANDMALETAEQAYCDGAVEGALVRRYGDSPEIQKARNELCRLVRAKHYSR